MSEEAKKPDAAPAEKEASSPAKGGASPLPAILAVVNLVFTLGIGAIVFIQFQKDKHKESVADIQVTEETTSEHGEKKEGEHAGGEHGGGEHGGAAKAKTGDQVLTLEQFTVNLSTSPGTPPRFARVVIALEVPSSETATEVTQKMAPVRNAILDLFNSKRPGDLQTGEGRNFLKEEIRNALNSFLITGKVKGVFFSNFVVGN